MVVLQAGRQREWRQYLSSTEGEWNLEENSLFILYKSGFYRTLCEEHNWILQSPYA